MKIAVLSGKGGVGKTFAAVNLTAVTEGASYTDCDVEEPNGFIFFKPRSVHTEDVAVKMPRIDPVQCNGCRKCAEFCAYNAIAFIGGHPVIYRHLCHACGGCRIVCRTGAITEEEVKIGYLSRSQTNKKRISMGKLLVGEASGMPLVRKLLEEENEGICFIDCPPGSGCMVTECIKKADYCLAVTEATPFGVHDLETVYRLSVLFKKRLAVIVNKYRTKENSLYRFCEEKKIEILAEIPFSRDLGRLCSEGRIAAWESDDFRELFTDLSEKIQRNIGYERATDYQR